MMCLSRLLCLLCWVSCQVAVSRSYAIKQGKWNFRGHPIAFETARSVKDDNNDVQTTSSNSSPTEAAVSSATSVPTRPVLLLNGFGVGSFHQHRLIHELLGDDQHEDRHIYCIDYLGQGMYMR